MRKLEVAYMETANTISVTLNGRFRSLSLNTDQGQKLLAAVKQSPQDIDQIAEIADIATYITRHTFGRVVVDDKDRLRLDGKVVDYGLSEIILRLVNDGSSVEHLTKFLENVSENPDENVPPHLYSFLQKGGMPITPDGCFHAFKKVDDDYRSFRAGNEDVTVIDALGVPTVVRGRIPHPVGGAVIMNREDCNPNRDQTCSVGLHACSPYYLSQWYGGNGRLLIVKINPRDVTAVPSDYNDAKLRCCRLEVVAEIPEEDAKTHFAKAVESRYTPPQTLGTLLVDGQPIGEVTEIEIEIEAPDDTLELTEGDILAPCGDCTCGADGRMNFAEVIEAGLDDGEDRASYDEVFMCDPEEGFQWAEVPEHFDLPYMMAFTAAYVEAFDLEDFYSESAFQQGIKDGQDKAAEDLQIRNYAAMTFTEGKSFEAMPDVHLNTYAKGYVVGYLNVFMLDDEQSQIAEAVNAILDGENPDGSGDEVVGD